MLPSALTSCVNPGKVLKFWSISEKFFSWRDLQRLGLVTSGHLMGILDWFNYSSTSGSLRLNPIDLLGWTVLCCGCCPVNCRLFSNMADLNPSKYQCHPQHSHDDNQKYFQTLSNGFYGGKIPPIKNHWFAFLWGISKSPPPKGHIVNVLGFETPMASAFVTQLSLWCKNMCGQYVNKWACLWANKTAFT